jgi:hypothetical protein
MNKIKKKLPCNINLQKSLLIKGETPSFEIKFHRNHTEKRAIIYIYRNI